MKVYKSLLVFIMSFSMVSCDTNTSTSSDFPSTSSTPSTSEEEVSVDNLWNEEYQDESNLFAEKDIKSTKLFYKGEYVDLNTQVSKRKDVKYEFYSEDSMRLVNSPEKYAVTIPSENVEIDYSLGKYRVQVGFDDSMLTITHETSNPYGTNSSSWHTYLNEWVNRYVDNPKYLEDNNLKYTRDVITSTSILEGYEVITYSILINDNQNVDKPYYDISIVRQEKEYVEFFMFVMKSKTNQSSKHDDIIKSFKMVDQFGYSENYVGQYEVKANPKWNQETLNYFNKINAADTLEFGFFSHSLVDDNDVENRDLVYDRVVEENKRLNLLTNYDQEICATYTHLAWGDTPMYFPSTLASQLASGNGFNNKPVLQFTLQYTTNNNNVNIYNETNNYTPMFDILRGKYDDYFTRLAKDIKAYGKPVLFRLNNEMNTDWTSYCGMITLLDPDIFQMTWIRLFEVFEKNNVDNCIWIFNPIAVSCPYSSWGEDLCYMPGTDYVQALGLTRYEMLNDLNTMKSFKDGYTILYEKNKECWMNYPWVVSEFGCAAGGAITEDGNLTVLYRNKDVQAKWVKDMFECLTNKDKNEFCKKISVMVWFNANDYQDGKILNSLYLDSRLTDTFAAFKEGFAKI